MISYSTHLPEKNQRPDRPEWTAAKSLGNIAERIVASYFRALGLAVEQHEGLAPHDLSIRGAIEVKGDKIAETSGNIAVETAYKNRPSGIITSTASGWAFVVGSEMLLMPTLRLRGLVANGNYRRVPAGENAVVALVPIEHIRAIAQSVSIPGAK